MYNEDLFQRSKLLFLNKEALNCLTVTLVEIGTNEQEEPQPYESDNAIYLLQGKDVVDEDLDNWHNE